MYIYKQMSTGFPNIFIYIYIYEKSLFYLKIKVNLYRYNWQLSDLNKSGPLIYINTLDHC